MKREIVMGVLILVLVAALAQGGGGASAQPSPDFDLSWFTVDGGGGTSAGGDFSLGGTIGQADAGSPLAGGDFTLTGGFWAGAVPTPGVERVCGDQNDDKVVNVFDAIIDLQIVVGLIEPTPTQLELSDLNQDGAINVFDVIMGLQHIVGLVPTLTDCGLPSG